MSIAVVSVVIPLYNKASHIARAIQSVLSQTCGDFELIVIDDGSTDNGAKVVESFSDPRIRLVHQQNSGVSAARNRGIAESRADLVAFLDADDEWRPDFLETIRRLVAANPECGAYATAYLIVHKDGSTAARSHQGIPESPWEGVIPYYFRSASSGPVCSSSVVVPRRVFDRIGHFEPNERRGEDTDMWCRIALEYPIAYSSRVEAVVHREAENRAGAQTGPSGLTVLETLRKALESGRLPRGVARNDVTEYKNRLHLSCAESCIESGLYGTARYHIRAASSTALYSRQCRELYVRSLVPGKLWDGVLRVRRSLRSILASSHAKHAAPAPDQLRGRQ